MNNKPSIDQWLAEAKAHESAKKIGMYLTHNGIVRESAKAKVREGAEGTKPVIGMRFSYDRAKVDEVIEETYSYTRAGTVIAIENINYLVEGSGHSIKNGIHYVKLDLRRWTA